MEIESWFSVIMISVLELQVSCPIQFHCLRLGEPITGKWICSFFIYSLHASSHINSSSLARTSMYIAIVCRLIFTRTILNSDIFPFYFYGFALDDLVSILNPNGYKQNKYKKSRSSKQLTISIDFKFNKNLFVTLYYKEIISCGKIKILP